ncbi:hypothetical protein B0H17DRAFT_162523 [Mycena rosella]|uniref:Uncharacterized protein n=1 Tax=Mycena rosella TaxID=1033263 RepID=A0AAD7D542_MYCRO|nr:hypothetical protein B0H17DRAFT_162523 [Mycena rosella]
MAHPSFLDVPTDFDLVKEVSHIPVEINNAELETGFTPAVVAQTDAVMGDGQYLLGYFRRQFDGVAHGFAVRANAARGQSTFKLRPSKEHLTLRWSGSRPISNSSNRRM